MLYLPKAHFTLPFPGAPGMWLQAAVILTASLALEYLH